MFATSLFLLKKLISTIDYNVVIRYFSFSWFCFYIIQILLLLTSHVAKYFL